MAKNIVICLDGTGNLFGKENTNVVTLFRVLKRNTTQVCYYDPGVGTLGDPRYTSSIANKLYKALGKAFGLGLIDNVIQAYHFLMENYQNGDRVYLFGFSRGAYTARVLAGLIHSVGLLESGSSNLIPYALNLYRSKPVDFEILAQFKATYGRNIHIDFLGLWDSVSTFGWIYNPVFLPFTTNNPSVKVVRHALAIDEKRAFFQPMMWGKEHQDKQDIKEVWFAGVHSDVGGGYPECESGLAKLSLQWMLREATAKGEAPPESLLKYPLRIEPKKVDRYVLGKGKDIKKENKYIGPDALAMQHESLKDAWIYVQGIPRSVWSVENKKEELRKAPEFRAINPGACLHESVLLRVDEGEYKPPSLKGLSSERLREIFTIEC